MPRRLVPFAAIPLLFLVVIAAFACDSDDNGDADRSGGTGAVTNSGGESGGGGGQDAVAGQQAGSVADIAERAGESVVRVGVNCRPDAPTMCEGTGSGWLYDDDGHFITNNHVVTLDGQLANPQSVTITTLSGRVEEAQVVGRDPQTDLAVLERDGLDMDPLELASVEETRIGSPVIAIGYALDLGNSPSVTTGVVSAKERAIFEPAVQIYGLLQTDAAINPGNSGGPLLDSSGRVLGVNTATIQGTQGIGFAIGADTVRAVATEILDKGSVDRGFLGIGFQEVTAGLADELDLPVDEGVRVEEVAAGSPADEAGLRQGDIIVRVDDTDIRFTSDLTLALLMEAPGETVPVEYYRGNDRESVDVTLGEPPSTP
ncbi:MAG: trypsin-like peptidase domain-containing protein [Dehalococcoidia bacterium]|nr:trypsin-like peptidase domain-containing protein [Dehalococcoidia bacterium]